jgi:hypothetical protein
MVLAIAIIQPAVARCGGPVSQDEGRPVQKDTTKPLKVLFLSAGWRGSARFCRTDGSFCGCRF